MTELEKAISSLTNGVGEKPYWEWNSEKDEITVYVADHQVYCRIPETEDTAQDVAEAICNAGNSLQALKNHNEKLQGIINAAKGTTIEMQAGKIYFIRFSGTEIVGRYKESDNMHHHFFSHLHYWNGFEQYRTEGYIVLGGIEEIREATQPEKCNLFRHELEKGDV